MKCMVQDCDQDAKRRGMCIKHYKKWLRYGNPLVSKYSSPGEGSRFIHEIALLYKGDECLSWPYSCNNYGYGLTYAGYGKVRLVHDIICEKVNGPRPSEDYVASHICGKGHLRCCNPNHIRWQTWKEDRADMVTHGTSPRGSRNGISKLTEESVREIRSLGGKLSGKEIAKKFGVSNTTISAILRRDRWSWLK